MSSERPFISHFSPQWTKPEYLEAILVQRGDLLGESVAAVRDSVLTGTPHHLLFVGPRGAGKTHLVTLIQHRLGQDPALRDRMRVAWLNEDEIATSFFRLLVAIYRSLGDRYPEEFPSSTIRALVGKDPLVAQEQLVRDLLHHLRGRVVVCILENLDSLFRSLGMAEQRNWRAFLQSHPVMVTVTTAQALFDGIADQDEPFFGFFDTRHLEPLDVEQARVLLERIATLQGRNDVAEFLRTARGRARVDAIRSLAGGNPRLYLIFSDLLVNAQVLDDLVRPFEEMVDRELTSFYQERLRWLSPQQREIVQLLCRSRSPIPVKQIAEGLFTTHNSITGQLKQLRELRYVDSHPAGREVYYELAEPLMRLALQVKETHDRRPLALIVDFLRIWHEEKELAARLAACPEDSPAREYLETAHRLLRTEPDLRLELFRRDLEATGPNQCDDATLEKARSVAEQSRRPGDWIRLGSIRAARGERDGAIADFTHAIELPDAPADQVARALNNRGSMHRRAGRIAEAIVDFTRAIELPLAPPDQVGCALNDRGVAHLRAGRIEEAIADFTRAVELPGAPPDQVARALDDRSIHHAENKDHEAVLRDLRQLFSISAEEVVREVVTPRVQSMARRFVLAAFAVTTDASRWTSLLAEFAGHFARFDGVTLLGDAVVRHLPILAASPLNHAAWDAWATAWEAARASLPPTNRDQLDIPLRLLRTGIAWLKTQDDAELLALPREERRVLREALGLSTESQE